MAATVSSPDEIAMRQLIEWCARIERRRRAIHPRVDHTPTGKAPLQRDTAHIETTVPTNVA